MGKPFSVILTIYYRKVLALLCVVAIAFPSLTFGMVRGEKSNAHAIHNFDPSVVYAFKAVFHTEETGTLSTHPQPPTQGRSQACLTYQGQLEPLRECFEGEDQRVRIPQPDKWPYTIHGQIESRSWEGIPFSGSGVLVGPQHFLTAAHCVYDGRKMRGWAQSLTIYPALNDASAPFGAVRGVKAYVYQQWMETEDPDFDITLVILENSVGNETGWAGMMAPPEEELRDRKVHVTGYPGDTDKRNQLWTMEDVLDRIDPETFSYKMHTSGGQSGGGIWIKQLASPVVVGVHTMGYVGRNFGVRLSKQKLQDIIGWIEETGRIRGIEAPLEGREENPALTSSSVAVSEPLVNSGMSWDTIPIRGTFTEDQRRLLAAVQDLSNPNEAARRLRTECPYGKEHWDSLRPVLREVAKKHPQQVVRKAAYDELYDIRVGQCQECCGDWYECCCGDYSIMWKCGCAIFFFPLIPPLLCCIDKRERATCPCCCPGLDHCECYRCCGIEYYRCCCCGYCSRH